MTLQEFFTLHPKTALAFSGGVDSAYLLWAARHWGAEIQPYLVRTQFQPAFEVDDARRICRELGCSLRIIELDILADETIRSNPPRRCYHCKRRLLGAILDAARRDGYNLVLDGTNASDDAGDRPGMAALQELQVCSPLREAGLTKAQIRQLSREAGLFTWDKPAYACLATRIPTGTAIERADLNRVARAEDTLRALGFRDFRVRLRGDTALLQIPQAQMPRLLEQRGQILAALRPDFSHICLDLEARP